MSKNPKLIDSLCIFLCLSVIVLNLIKFWGSYSFGLNHRILTFFQTLIPIIILVIIMTSLRKIKNPFIIWAFLAYHSARCLAEMGILFFTDQAFDKHVQIQFTFTRIIDIFALFTILILGTNEVKNVRKYFIYYFVYTTLYSIMQLPFSPLSGILTDYGGNSISGNGLGIVRTNGGLGGTVIMYANYLLAVFFVLFYTSKYSKNTKNILWIIFVISMYLCFSRSLFVAVLINLFLFYFMNNRIKTTIVSFITLAILITWRDYFNQLYELMVENSDIYRLENWALLFTNYDLLTILEGKQAGANTGYHLNAYRKINADGVILSWLYDFGVIGLILLLLVLWNAIKLVVRNKIDRVAIFMSLSVMLFVNSGFEKIFVVEMYFISLIIIKTRLASHTVKSYAIN